MSNDDAKTSDAVVEVTVEGAPEPIVGSPRRRALRRQAILSWHLANNFFPPLPDILLPTAEQALDLADSGDWENLVDLPKGMTVNGKEQMPVSEVIDWLRLETEVSPSDTF